MCFISLFNEGALWYSGKTVEEVWQAIQAGKAGERGNPTEPVTLGNFLQSVGVDMPSAVSSDFNLATLGHLQEEGKVSPHLTPHLLASYKVLYEEVLPVHEGQNLCVVFEIVEVFRCESFTSRRSAQQTLKEVAMPQSNSCSSL